jgi:hypothetical protein
MPYVPPYAPTERVRRGEITRVARARGVRRMTVYRAIRRGDLRVDDNGFLVLARPEDKPLGHIMSAGALTRFAAETQLDPQIVRSLLLTGKVAVSPSGELFVVPPKPPTNGGNR